ncbi:sugar phosphate nucleotidyltransferase [Planktothrix agardhii]|uniref:sugar phosphate nucleotidyltransferase n=1 Tax=Planktothrix agardhii TaxID=1160 RepID=UPI001F2660CD|nr:sugar phosphate nucleotidyltransferase [Planktothrix agardhii]MCF3576382.1 NTP transferase domain-containing protein [Planktothrix agardhii 1812]
MKALILSGGKGTRLRPLTYTGAKQLVPVANKPILWYGIEGIVAAGITEIGIIISPETGEEVKNLTGNGDRFGAKITYILQEQPAGLAHAVKVGQPFLGDSPFIMYLGDNLIESQLSQFSERFKQQQLDALILLRTVSNPSAFGVAVVDDQGRVLKLVEKPKVPPSNLALVGVYFFDKTIHEAIAKILEGWWLDTGKKDDLLSANQIILDSCITYDVAVEIDEKSQILGRVKIGKNTKLVNCSVRGPVIIGENCYLENCFVGPYSSIDNKVTLIDAEIEHSVILSEAKIIGINQRIVDTVIGRRASLSTAPQRPKALRFMIGDDSQVELA